MQPFYYSHEEAEAKSRQVICWSSHAGKLQGGEGASSHTMGSAKTLLVRKMSYQAEQPTWGPMVLTIEMKVESYRIPPQGQQMSNLQDIGVI